MAEDELYSFEGAELKFGEDFPPEEVDSEQDVTGNAVNEGNTSNSESDIESEGGPTTSKEIRRGRGQKRRPAVSDSDSDDPFYNLFRSSNSKAGNLSKKKTKTTTPKNLMVNTPKTVPRSAPPKKSLPTTSATMSRGKSVTPSRSASTKDARSTDGALATMSTTADKDKEKDVESLSFAVLKEISSKLNSVAERVVRMESKLEAMEKRCTPSSSSDARTPKQKRVIPHTLRLEVRRMYQTLLSEDDHFEGFVLDSGTAFSDAANKAITNKLIKEVQAQNPTFESGDIHAATYTYYRSLSQEQSLRDRGLHDQWKIERRRRQRIQRKLQIRLSTFSKANLRDSEREKWAKVFIADMMSSEESDPEDDNIMIIKELPFRHQRVGAYFRAIDIAANKRTSSQAMRQMKKRVLKGVSDRSAPSGVPKWSVVASSSTEN